MVVCLCDMKILGIFAHPDDEAFAVAGTIKRLTQLGNEVVLIYTTDGGAGEVHPDAQKEVEKLGSIKKLRRDELQNGLEILRVNNVYFFDYGDGELNNKMVYGNELVNKIKKVISKEKPEIVLAYDQTGISFHTDHIITSLAATRAVLETKIVDKMFVFCASKDFVPSQEYVLPVRIEASHFVDIKKFKEFKIEVLKKHLSQKSGWERFLSRKNNSALKIENFFLRVDRKRSKEIFKLFEKAKT